MQFPDLNIKSSRIKDWCCDPYCPAHLLCAKIQTHIQLPSRPLLRASRHDSARDEQHLSQAAVDQPSGDRPLLFGPRRLLHIPLAIYARRKPNRWRFGGLSFSASARWYCRCRARRSVPDRVSCVCLCVLSCDCEQLQSHPAISLTGKELEGPACLPKVCKCLHSVCCMR